MPFYPSEHRAESRNPSPPGTTRPPRSDPRPVHARRLLSGPRPRPAAQQGAVTCDCRLGQTRIRRPALAALAGRLVKAVGTLLWHLRGSLSGARSGAPSPLGGFGEFETQALVTWRGRCSPRRSGRWLLVRRRSAAASWSCGPGIRILHCADRRRHTRASPRSTHLCCAPCSIGVHGLVDRGCTRGERRVQRVRSSLRGGPRSTRTLSIDERGISRLALADRARASGPPNSTGLSSLLFSPRSGVCSRVRRSAGNAHGE